MGLAVYLIDKDLGPSEETADTASASAASPLSSVFYANQYPPLIAAMPWTMPATASREPVSQPEVYCISSDRSCHCLTEQGTRYELPDQTCRDIARWGPSYNPFRQPLNTIDAPPEAADFSASTVAHQQPTDVPSAPVTASPSTVFGTLHPYGSFDLPAQSQSAPQRP